jgi:hypothetical protein
MAYKQLPIEEYLQTEKIKILPQEVKDEIRRVRTTYEPIDFDLFIELHVNQRIIKRTAKLKFPRSLFICPEEKIWYFNHYKQQFQYCGYFFSLEFLAEREAKEEAFKAEVLENRRIKKLEKQKSKQTVELKPKRKRITK